MKSKTIFLTLFFSFTLIFISGMATAQTISYTHTIKSNMRSADWYGIDDVYNLLQKVYNFIKKIYNIVTNLPMILYNGFFKILTFALNSLASLISLPIQAISDLFGIAAPLAMVVVAMGIFVGTYIVIKIVLYVI